MHIENTEEKIEIELPEGEVDNSAADLDASASDQLSEGKQEETEEEETKLSAEDRVKQFYETDDELKAYGEGVQKRIDKLTYKFREAERREKAAIEYAQGVQAKLDEQKTQLDQREKSLFQEYTSRVESELEQAKVRYKEAIATDDADAIVVANQELARLSVEQENLRRVKAQREGQQPAPQQQVQQAPQQQAPQQQAAPDPHATAWAEKNEWFGKDNVMTYAAMGIHRDLVEVEGVDPTLLLGVRH